MSLLMETIKKAEEVRREADSPNAPAASATVLTLEALGEPPLTAPIGSPLPNLSQHLAAVDADLAAISSAPPMTERSAVRKAFAPRQPPETDNTLWLIVGLGLLAILGVGGYFWWQLQALQSPDVVRPMTMPSAISVPVSAVPAAPASQAEESSMVRTAPETAVLSTEKFAVSASVREPVAPSVSMPGTSAQIAAEPRQEQTDTTFRLTRAAPQTNITLEHAYEALQSGRDEDAQRDYEKVLRADGKSTDALLGLATLAARQGQVDIAHGYYLRALEADPNDPTARAGVLSTGRQGDDKDSESLLKTALARQSDSPPLLVALGNLYARQQRWSEAQQTYFQAYTGEPDNPDIIFNLAVSLDHLRQNKLAAQYYQMALDAGDIRTAAFDRNRVKTRLLELQP
jgi:tetratricopeptide (TPR) repeat protein